MESSWSNGQIELFHALGKICERVGQEGADELLRKGSDGDGLNTLDGRGFVAELRELRERAGLVDGLEKKNMLLRAELDTAREQLLNLKSANSIPKVGNGAGETVSRSMRTQTKSTQDYERDVDWYTSHERLIQKYNVLTGSYQELMLARDQLESKLRSSQKSTREWVEYANGLEKKIGRLQGKLTSHGIPLQRRSERSSVENIPPAITPNSHELMPVKAGEASLETLRRELPNLLHMSERISELARNAGVESPGYNSSHPPQYTSTDSSERQQKDRDGSNDPSPLIVDPIRLFSALSASNRDSPLLSSTLLMEATPEHHDSAHPVSSESHHSSSTEEDVDALPYLSHQEQLDIPAIIKAEPLSDSPVVISSSSVKKRKAGNRTDLNESASYTKVKVEILTSSPIGLAGFHGLFPQDSLDLDEIGEKINTPKKRRKALTQAYSGYQKNSHNKLPAELTQGAGLQQSENNSHSEGNLSALQPASPNKQILPRTSGKGRALKRRRLEDRLRGAVILGEDGEDDVTCNIDSETDIQIENIRKLPANAAELQQRLSGLLEGPSAGKEVLTPLRPRDFSAATAQLRARATPAHKNDKATTPARRQFGVGTAQNTITISGETPKTAQKSSTANKRTARTSRSNGAYEDDEADDQDQEPLRARPVHRLGLEHFKINPFFNQGSDYAFTDVVRGRELRKCLPGCTKPTCCGDKFRKFIEFARAHEERTLSQEEEDVRLLEEYLGDNKSRLRNMTQNEKEELLIQARTRNLANKASKHRHAYERRQSPPGFWRSDFPSTQELEKDRQEAANRERELVQQRHEEAMRPGGRWLFRDE